MADLRFLDVENRRSIIDRRTVSEHLRDLRSGKRLSAEAAAILRDALEHGRAEIAKRLTEEPGDGRSAAQATAFLHDQLVRLVHDFVNERMLDEPLGEDFALVGLGGTGRGEMAPYSDLDLMLLLRRRNLRGQEHQV